MSIMNVMMSDYEVQKVQFSFEVNAFSRSLSRGREVLNPFFINSITLNLLYAFNIKSKIA